MVARSLLVLWLLVIVTCLQAETVFQVKLIGDEPLANIELGKPLWLELTSNRPTPSLDTINFNELDDQFHIDKTLPINVDQKSGAQSWRIRLYAYTTGAKSIPALVYVYQRSSPLSIEITSAMDPKTSTPIQLQTYLSHPPNHTVWLREQILLRYAITTNNTFSQFHVADSTEPKLEVRPFKLATKPLTAQQFQYTLGWSMHAKQTGQLHLELPPLQFINDGVPTHHFYHPPLQLEIKPLPIYVPATMPVGQISIDLPNTWRFTFSNSLAEFQVDIIGNGLPLNQIPDIANEMASTRSLRIYPARGETQELFTENGIASQASYQIPYKPIAQGLLLLEPILLNYFDPRTATIKTIQRHSLQVFAINRWLATFIAAILLYLVYRTTLRLYRFINRKIKLYHGYHLALQRLAESNSTEEFRACMSLIALAEQLPANLSVGQWLERVIAQYPVNRNELHHDLNCFFYKKEPTIDTNNLRQKLITVCLQQRRLLKLIHKPAVAQALPK